MTADDFPEHLPARTWLMTLADLALLLVGFFVFLQASEKLDRASLAKGIREGFGVTTAPPAPVAAMPVDAGGLSGFTPGSATLPNAPDSLIAWARAATRDPRVTLTVSGSVDGSAADIDAATGSGAVLAVDRARAVAAALAAARAVPPGRMTIATAQSSRRAVRVTLAFTGQPPRNR